MKKYVILLLIGICFGCDSDSSDYGSASPNATSEAGQGGSLARFTILNDYLYTVDNQYLNVFNISNPEQPVQVNTVEIGFDIETLFNYKQYLYIGSRNGMYIYSIANPESPEYLSDVRHFTACDPVVANDRFAFVTLHADIGCGTNINRLEIYDISDILNPVLISNRNLIKPIGLGLYHNYLFVCDDEVKIFDISDPENSLLVHSINRNAFDVIIQNNLLILIGENGLYQYSLDPNDIENINELSQLNI